MKDTVTFWFLQIFQQKHKVKSQTPRVHTMNFPNLFFNFRTFCSEGIAETHVQFYRSRVRNWKDVPERGLISDWQTDIVWRSAAAQRANEEAAVLARQSRHTRKQTWPKACLWFCCGE